MHRYLFPLVALMAVAAATVVLVAPASDADRHCVAHIVDVLDTGELVLSEPVCVTGDETARAALVDGHLTEVDAQLAASGLSGEIRLSGSLLGIHYDGVYSGSSFSVTGSDCNGGWVNLSSYWSNRVSSTINGICTRVKHHDYHNKVGSYQSTWGSGGALSYMNNRANSISYNMA
jgi:hypothetical protein